MPEIVVVGGVATGPKTAARLRRLDPEASITLVERQSLTSYAGCGIPFYLEGAVGEWEELLGGATPRDATYFKERKGVQVYTETEATSIDREQKTVAIRDLRTGTTRKLEYDYLVLATGARPLIPPIEGIDLEGVHTLHTPLDALEVAKEVEEGYRNIAIVGGGLIGVEAAGALLKKGCKVSILEMMPNLVPGILDPELALLLENHLKANGVGVYTGEPVTSLEGEGGRVSSVETRGGRRIQADMVLVCVGVRPNVELAVAAGLETGPTRAIAVNERLQTSDPAIYAGGDCVENLHLVTGEKVYAPLGSTANKHGRVIADNIAGIPSTFPGVCGTTVFKSLGYNCGATGLTEGKAREKGFDAISVLVPRYDIPSYMPGAARVFLKLVAERGTGRILGLQGVGPGEVVKRVDVAATAISMKATLEQVANMDLGYAPPYSTAQDALAHAANTLDNKIKGIAHGLNPRDLKAKLDSGEDMVILDVRSRAEYQERRLHDARVVNIPLTELKARAGEIPQGKPIVTICAIGVRAYEAERVLRGLGWRDVWFLEGSMEAWPYPQYLE